MREFLQEIESWRKAGQRFAVATVIQTWGSAPRQAGSVMVIREDMQVVGSVSGGCIEGAVIEAAQTVLDSGTPRVLEFGVSDETAWSVGLSCGGRIKVLVEPHISLQPQPDARQTWEQLQQAWAEEKGVILIRKINDQAIRYALLDPQGDGSALQPPLSIDMWQITRQAYRERTSQLAELGGGEWFIQVYPPRPHMIIIGAGHLSVALVPLAKMLNFRTTVIDPRGVFANPERFPVAPDVLLNEWPNDVLKEIPLHEECYAVLLTHDPKIDDPALEILLTQPLAYVGALGSRRTHARRRGRLLEKGLSKTQIDRIAAPIGLDLGAKTPQEIAVSIIAQVVERRRKRSAHAE